MTLNLTSEQEAQILQLAQEGGREPNQLITEAAIWLTRHVQDLASLQRSIDQADRGEFIEEDEMDARVARMLDR